MTFCVMRTDYDGGSLGSHGTEQSCECPLMTGVSEETESELMLL